MSYWSLVVLVAAVIAVNALEHGEGADNPIIEFFEAPVRAFKTKVPEDYEHVISSAPEGKSAGIAKSQNNSWFRGKGLANWLMSRAAGATTTTTLPEVVLNTPMGNNQQLQGGNFNAPNRRRVVKRNNVQKPRPAQYGMANGNWNARRNVRPNKRRVNHRPVYDDDAYSDEDDYGEFNNNNRRRYNIPYESVPYQSNSYDDADDDVSISYVPFKNQQLRRGPYEHKKNNKPASSYLQPFQDIPVQARPVRLRQNLPATKPIGNKQQQQAHQQQNNKPMKPNRNPANNNNNNNNNNKNKKKKNKNKNKNKPGNNNVVQQDPVHFIVHPQGNGQLPILIPVNGKNPNRKENMQNVMSDPTDYQNYQYIPIPVQAFHQAGFKGIPQIQVIAQHTHTFRPQPHHAGFPTEVILGPTGYDNVYLGQNDTPEHNNMKKKNNKHNNGQNQMNMQGQNQRIVLTTDESMNSEPPMTVTVQEHMVDPTKATILVEEMLKPESTMATQTTSNGEEVMEVTVSADEKLDGTDVRSVDSRPHIVVPRHIFPIVGAGSLVEVANNGRFFLKTGRDLKIADHEPGHIDDHIDELLHISEKQSALIDTPKNEEFKSDPEHSITKKDEVPLETKPEPASPTPDAIPPVAESKPEASNVAKKEIIQPEKLAIRPEQLHDVPVTIVHDEPVAKQIHGGKSGRAVSHHGHRPILRSEVVHEKANGHFIVKSGVAPPAAESRSHGHHIDSKTTDSEIKNIKITPIENSRAL